MEVQLQHTRDTVDALRELLSPIRTPSDIEVRLEPALAVWFISTTVTATEIDTWFSATVRRLRDAVAAATGVESEVVLGGLYDRALFLEDRGEATLFVAAPESADPPDRVQAQLLTQAQFAVLMHTGGHEGIDRSCAALGTYTNEHLISDQGPIREHYLGGTPTEPTTFTATEIRWPSLSTNRLPE